MQPGFGQEKGGLYGKDGEALDEEEEGLSEENFLKIQEMMENILA